MFLITTADQRYWKTDEPVLFLGEWCKLFSQRGVWEKLDYKVLPYHWDDRTKLHRDYIYLQSLYEALLVELTEQLNYVHNVNKSLRYWRIIVGPWLSYFVQILFDRWSSIQQAVSEYSISGVRILDIDKKEIIPNDMVHFHCLYETDHWNASIYSQLIKGWTSVPIEKLLQSTPLKSTELTYHNLIRNRRFKRNLAHAASFVLKAYTQEDEAFFIETYLPKKQDFFMQLRMGQVPKLWIRRAAPKTKVDFTWRLWKLGNESAEGYAAIVRSMIPCHIPALYLEGYSNLIACCNDLTWPKKPRLIFTSNAYGSNDMFKAWAAGKVEVGVPLVVGQHGGMYGIGLWNSGEDHEHAISDVWLSWGWEDAERPNIKPVGNLKITRARTKSAPNGHALMVEMAMPRYSYMLYSVPVARQWLDYLDEQFRFVEALPSEIRRNLLVRLYKHDYGWDQIARWRKRFHDVQIDDGNSSMAKLINKARIYIATYNATTFLESLALDIPTIIFWNPAHWEIRNSAINSFKQLQAVGIFHNTPEAAAHHMTRIWPDIALWWYSEEVQMVRQEFCWRYSRISKRHLDDLEKIFSVFKKNL